jgi:triacylglycerol lipase
MPEATRELLKSLGCELTHGLIEQTHKHLANAMQVPERAPAVLRDVAYGPHERHRLDIFAHEGARDAPIIVFVHGGGYVMGDKRLPGLPFYDNVGQWAADAGFIGVTINYRLAPDHMWPAGAEDVAQAVAWLRANIAFHGGDPRRIFLMGQSAGAVHVAGYLSLPALLPEGGVGVAGAILVSGAYDLGQTSPNPYALAYYGTDHGRHEVCSTLTGLIKTPVPLCIVVAEYDGIDFRRQAALLVGAFGKARGDIPRIHWLPGHNHLSTILAIGTPYDAMGPLVSEFVHARVQG